VAERADDRLLRLLGIVAYLDGAGPVSVADLARRFGTTPAQIQKDVDALWVSGTPGYWPDTQCTTPRPSTAASCT
jgi:proteasome accessory factor C